MPMLSTRNHVVSTKTRLIDMSGFGMPDPRKKMPMPRVLKNSIDEGVKRPVPPVVKIAARVQYSAVPRVALPSSGEGL